MLNEPELLSELDRMGGVDRSWPRETRREDLASLSRGGLTSRHLGSLPDEAIRAFQELPSHATTREVYEALLPRPPSPLWGEKSIRTALSWRLGKDLYPTATFIHVVRDPRTAVRSALVKRGRDPATLTSRQQLTARRSAAHLACRWNRFVCAGDEASVLGNDYLRVRYEDLVASPQLVIEGVCDFLDLDYEPIMGHADARKSDVVLTSAGGVHHRRLTEPIGASSDLQPMPSLLRAAVERVATEGMARTGYVPESSVATRASEALVRGAQWGLDRSRAI